ncbi:MAG: hypothetical protein HC915_08250 [Anaerolineae bacterium]|nr:hypothetical protein [Anaerolineae bacterium]
MGPAPGERTLCHALFPGCPEPEKQPIRVPEPTDAYTAFATLEFGPQVRAGIQVMITRSLFECISLVVPTGMFEGVTAEPANPGRLAIEQAYFKLALELYKTTAFSIATLGVERGCQLLLEMIANPQERDSFLKTGNFLASDDALGALRTQPRTYQEVMPALRWCPPAEATVP